MEALLVGHAMTLPSHVGDGPFLTLSLSICYPQPKRLLPSACQALTLSLSGTYSEGNKSLPPA